MTTIDKIKADLAKDAPYIETMWYARIAKLIAVAEAAQAVRDELRGHLGCYCCTSMQNPGSPARHKDYCRYVKLDTSLKALEADDERGN